MLTKNTIYGINSKKDLDEIFTYLKRFKFSEDDIKDEHEILSILLFVASLSKSSLLNLPVNIDWKESPDFRFKFTNDLKTIGIEHVRATLPEYKMADREFQKRPKGCFLEPSFYSPFKKVPRKEAYIGIRNPDEELKGDGWEGDSLEIEWAYTIINALISKTNLLNKLHFETFEENHLLIEDDSPVDLFRNLPIAINYLRQIHRSVDLGQNRIQFDKVHIFSIHDFIYDVFDKCINTDISKKSLAQTGVNKRKENKNNAYRK